mgnify:CR=1 FL=1
MKIKIAILGSTGSIGKSTIKIIKDNPENFDVVLLTANNNYKELAKQANELKAKNLIINNPKILADGAHIIHYYSHFNYILNLDLYDKYNPKFYTKLNNTYYDLSYLLNNKFFDIIIIKKNRFFTLKELNNFYLLGYKLINNQNYHILFIK